MPTLANILSLAENILNNLLAKCSGNYRNYVIYIYIHMYTHVLLHVGVEVIFK